MSTIYWIEMLGRINIVLVILGIILSILSFFAFFIFISDVDDSIKIKKIAIRFLFSSLTCWVAFIFVPDSEQAYRIYGIGYIIDNKNAKNLPNKTLKVLDKWADNYLEDKGDSIK